MKKLSLFATLAILVLAAASCTKNDYKSFIGTWGVEKIEYYNIDYAGNPISASYDICNYDPNDLDNGIQLIFREDKTGEMHDSAIDTLWIENEETGEYDSFIYCPDTTFVYPFTYSYDKNENVLYMNVTYENTLRTFRMYIDNLTKDSFTYENEYDKDYVERAYLKRISDKPSKSASKETPKHPHKRGAFLGDR